jgi:hypothetical protein
VTPWCPVVSTVTPRRRTDYLSWKQVQQSIRSLISKALVELTGGDLMKM